MEWEQPLAQPPTNDYALQRSSCILKSIERLYQSSFIFYTGPQSHYAQRKLGPKALEWLRKSQGKSKEDVDEETKAQTKRKALQSLAKEFRLGVRQQRTRRKTKEKSWYTSTCPEYVENECVGTLRSPSAQRGSSKGMKYKLQFKTPSTNMRLSIEKAM